MKRLLLLGGLAAAALVPTAAAAPTGIHTLHGTVVGKDRAHHALVVALPGGKVQTVVAPAAFGRTHLGRRVVIRYTGLTGRLPVAARVSLRGQADHAVVRGTIVRLVKRQAVINAGGSVLRVTLRGPKRQRTLASAGSGPRVGDTVKVEVEIDDDGSLDASAIVVTAAGHGVSAGRMEVRGKVTALEPSTSTVPGLITLDVTGLPVSCAISPGANLDVQVGDMIELECDAIGNPAVWTARAGHGEDEHADADDDGEQSDSGDDDHEAGPGDDADGGESDD